MWEYKIAHYPKENERAIFREDEIDTWWLTADKKRTREKKYAKRFLHEDEAVWALVTIKMTWELEEKKPSKPKVVADTWGGLSFG